MLLLPLFLFVFMPDTALAAKKPTEASAVIEEVTAKQLERILNDKDFVAVYWCKCVCEIVNCCLYTYIRTLRVCMYDVTVWYNCDG